MADLTPQQTADAQTLDNFTVLQQADAAPLEAGSTDVKADTTNVAEPDRPSLYNNNTDPNNSTNNLLAATPNGELDTVNLVTEETAIVDVLAEGAVGDGTQAPADPTATVTAEAEATQSTVFLNPVGTNGDRLATPGSGTVEVTADGTAADQPVANPTTVEATAPAVEQAPIPAVDTPAVPAVEEPPIDTVPTPQEPVIDPPDDGQIVVISVTTEELVDVVTNVLAPVVTTVFSDATTRVNDLEANKEVITTTRTYTDTSVVTTDVTTTRTLITRTTYSDGTVETAAGTPTVTETTSDAPTVTVREEVISTILEDPALVITYETVVDSVTGDTTVETTFSDVTTRENDLTNNKETVTVTRTYTDVKTTPTTETTTVTPVYTYTYTNGTVEVERQTATVTDETTYDVVTETRVDVVSTGTEEPTIVTTYEVVETVDVADPVTVTDTADPETVKTRDDENDQWVLTTTVEYTDTTTVDTTTTTTTTPVYTITYTDGTVETERGTPAVVVDTTVDTTVDVRTETVEVAYEPFPEDGNESATALFNTAIGGNLLENTTPVTGEDFVVVEVTVDGQTVTLDPEAEFTTVTVDGVGEFAFAGDGTWAFAPDNNYSGPVPAVDYTLFDGEITDTSVLTISDIPVTLISTLVEDLVDVVTDVSAPVVTSEYADTTVRENDLDANKETVTVTRKWTDTSVVTTDVTTTRTSVTKNTYSDGTVETIPGTPSVTEETSDAVTVTYREEVIFTGTEEPTIVTTFETVVVSVVGATTVETTYSDSTVRENDLVNNRELVTVTRNYTDVKTTPTTETTTVTPIYTITYSDGTVEVERGTAAVSEVVTYDVVTELRNDVIDNLIEYPTIVTTYEVVENVVVGDPTTTTTAGDPVEDRVRDPDNSRWVVTTTVDYTDTTTVDTTKTTTTTPVYTITYTDGAVETERGTATVDTATTTDVTTQQRQDIDVEYEAFQNNGFGNGDDSAPGGSDDSNNAENSGGGTTPPVEPEILVLDLSQFNLPDNWDRKMDDFYRLVDSSNDAEGWVIQLDQDGPSKKGSGRAYDWTTVADNVDPDSVQVTETVINYSEIDPPPNPDVPV